jgi:hypothetical protein
MIRANCPNCRAVYDVPDEQRGRPSVCQKCGRSFVLGEPQGLAAEQPIEIIEAVLVSDDPVSEPPKPRVPEPSRPMAPAVQNPASTGEPFSLQPDERVLLRGGFGGAYGWTLLVSLVVPLFGLLMWVLALFFGDAGGVSGACCMLPWTLGWIVYGSWPWLRSGTYWLTNQRVHWKPRLGEALTVSFPEIAASDVRVSPLTSSLHIRGARKASLRYIRGSEKLWGGVNFFSQLGSLPAPSESAASTAEPLDAVWWQAVRGGTVSSQLGVAVWRPGYFAFLPSQARENLLLGMAGAFAGQAVHNATGIRVVSSKAKAPLEIILPELMRRSPSGFDAMVFKAVDQFGGLLWKPGEATVTREIYPIGDSTALAFREGKDAVRGTVAQDQLPLVEAFAPRWTGGESLPRTFPVRRFVVGSCLLTLLPLLPIVGVLSHQEGPVVDMGQIDLATALDRQKVPSGSYVTVSGRPDADSIGFVSGRNIDDRQKLLLVLQEEPRLILYCSGEHPLGQAVHRYHPSSFSEPKPEHLDEVTKVWSVAGRIYDYGEKGEGAEIPSRAVREFAKEDLELANTSDVRVLMVGSTPQIAAETAAANNIMGLVCVLVMGLPAAIMWVLTVRLMALARQL